MTQEKQTKHDFICICDSCQEIEANLTLDGVNAFVHEHLESCGDDENIRLFEGKEVDFRVSYENVKVVLQW